MTLSVVDAGTLMAKWPDKLIDRILARDWVLVVGAGISRHATNGLDRPASWTSLISSLAAKFTRGDELTLVSKLLEAGQMLDAAEVIKQAAIREGKETDFLERVRTATDGPAANPFMPADVHKQLINDLEPQIIVTTNYDKVLERATSNGYNVHRPGDVNLGSDVRTGLPALVKPHGTVDDLTKIVLTRSDFATIRSEASELYAVLSALFLTKTCLFVGYSFQDPDLMLLLENVFAGKGRAGAHYWLAPDNGPAHLKQIYQRHYGIETVTYDPVNEHEQMIHLIQGLCFRVSTSSI